jgi:hypothetical protein
MSQKLNSKIPVIGIDIGKNSFHIVGQNKRGAIVLRQKCARLRPTAVGEHHRASSRARGSGGLQDHCPVGPSECPGLPCVTTIEVLSPSPIVRVMR